MTAALLPYVVFIGEFVLKLTLVAIIVLRGRSGKPGANLAWIVLVLALPFVGLIVYLLIGEVRLGGRREKRHRTIVDRMHAPALIAAARPTSPPQVQSAFRTLAVLGEAVGDHVPRNGNVLQLITDTDVFVQSLVEDIEQAADHCHLLFYIFLDDHSGARVGQALIQAARRGVRCRVLADGVGSRRFLRSSLRASMKQAGVEVVEALPAKLLRLALARLDLRNHRKIAVIDGAIGYTGSHNLADAQFAIKSKYAPWVDTMVRIVGPVVRDLQLLFVEDWFLDTNKAIEEVLSIAPPHAADGVTAQIMGTGPSANNQAMRQLLQASFHAAQEELILTTPYFVPDDATASAVSTTAQRGVETTLVVPARNDSPLVAAASRSFYRRLLDAGVRICEFDGGLLHAKTTTIDRDFAMVSTANLDRRSFDLNFEVSLVVYDSDFASQLRFIQRGYQSTSREVDPATWRRRAWPIRLTDNAAGLLAPVL